MIRYTIDDNGFMLNRCAVLAKQQTDVERERGGNDMVMGKVLVHELPSDFYP